MQSRSKSRSNSLSRRVSFLIILCIYFLAVLGLHCSVGFSLAAAIRAYSLVVVHGLLIAVAFLVEQKVGSRAHGLQ